jgi:hypothetical protein
MKRFEKGQGATEYLLMLAAVLVIVAIAVYYITMAPVPSLAAVPKLVDNDDIGIEITVAGPRIAAVDWEYAVVTTTGTPASWNAGTQAIGDVTGDVTLVSDQPSGTYYVWLRHKPTGHIWIDGTPAIQI